jgi:hypothetical protein
VITPNACEPFQEIHHEGHKDGHKEHKDFFVAFVKTLCALCGKTDLIVAV